MWLHVLWFILKIWSGFPFARGPQFPVAGHPGGFQVGLLGVQVLKVSADIGRRFSPVNMQGRDRWLLRRIEGCAQETPPSSPAGRWCRLPAPPRSGGQGLPTAPRAAPLPCHSAVSLPDSHHPRRCDMLSHSGLTLHVLRTHVDHLSMSFLAICMSLWCDCWCLYTF